MATSMVISFDNTNGQFTTLKEIWVPEILEEADVY